ARMGNSRSPALPDACDILEGNFMVKVLCKGGPYYWIKEPFNALERQVWLWDLAQSAKKGRAYHQEQADAGGPKTHVHRELLELFEPRWQETIAAAPPRRPTRAERNRFRRQYRQKYFLLDSEIYPRDATDPPDPLEHALNNLTSI